MVTPGIVASSLKVMPGDYFGSTTSFAYSVRKLFRNPYNTYCLRVMRSSDNTTQDIGFTEDGWLDVAAIESFVGSGNTGYLDIWYNQTNNTTTRTYNLDTTSSTASEKPVICESGVVPTDHNGKPIIKFTSANSQRIWRATNVTVSHFADTNGSSILGFVGKCSDPATYPRQTFMTTGLYSGVRYDLAIYDGSPTMYWDHGNYFGLRFDTSLPSNFLTDNNQKQIYAASSSSEVMYFNGTLHSTQTPSGTYSPTSRRFSVGAFWNGSVYEAFYDGYIQEILVVKKSYVDADIEFLKTYHDKHYPL